MTKIWYILAVSAAWHLYSEVPGGIMADKPPVPNAAPKNVAKGIRALQAIKLAAISYRQLDYWSSQGFVRPSIAEAHGSGTVRLYSDMDILHLSLIKALLDGGIALKGATRASELIAEVRVDQLYNHVIQVRPDDDAELVHADALAESMAGQGFAVATVVSLRWVLTDLVSRYRSYDMEPPAGWASE